MRLGILKTVKAVIGICVAVSFTFSSFADNSEDILELKSGQPIMVDGDMVEYSEGNGEIVAEGNVVISYGKSVLSCDKIVVNTKTKKALCEGNVRVEQPEGVLTGERIRYDFDKEKGEIIGAEVDAFPWFGHAAESSKVAENEYVLKNGYITTCDLDVPHYRIKGQEIRIFPNEKVIVKNVTFYIGKIPVLWFPYYYHPLVQSRAKVQFIPGSSTDWGYFLLSAWRFYIKGETKVDVLVDYRSKKGFAEGANVYYDTTDFYKDSTLGEGVLSSYFIHENDKGTYAPTAFTGDGRDDNTNPELRKRIQWKHRIDFEPGTVGMLEFNRFSDEYVLKDYFYNEYEEVNRTPANYVSVVSAKENYTFSLMVNERFHDFYTVVQKHPEVKIDVPDQRLWDTRFYYGGEHSATVFDKEYAFSTEPPEETERFDSFHKFSYVTALGPLKLTPYGTVRGTAYSRTRWEKDRAFRFIPGGGLNAFMKFHRIFDVTTNILGLNINKLRHIIMPSAKYFHTHQPTVDKDNLFQMDSIDTLEKENGVTLALENKLQIKRGFGDDLDPVDMVRFIISTNYLFRMEKRAFEMEKGGQFRDLTFDIELKPYDWLFIDTEVEIETKNQAMRTGSIEATLNPTDDFSMAMGYRYEKKIPEPRNQYTFDLMYRINPKWRIGLYERLNFQDFSIEEQQLSITRDLHCWEVEFVYNVEGENIFEDEFTVWFAFKIKAFPDLQLGLSQSFSKRAPGAAASSSVN